MDRIIVGFVTTSIAVLMEVLVVMNVTSISRPSMPPIPPSLSSFSVHVRVVLELTWQLQIR